MEWSDDGYDLDIGVSTLSPLSVAGTVVSNPKKRLLEWSENSSSPKSKRGNGGETKPGARLKPKQFANEELEREWIALERDRLKVREKQIAVQNKAITTRVRQSEAREKDKAEQEVRKQAREAKQKLKKNELGKPDSKSKPDTDKEDEALREEANTIRKCIKKGETKITSAEEFGKIGFAVSGVEPEMIGRRVRDWESVSSWLCSFPSGTLPLGAYDAHGKISHVEVLRIIMRALHGFYEGISKCYKVDFSQFAACVFVERNATRSDLQRCVEAMEVTTEHVHVAINYTGRQCATSCFWEQHFRENNIIVDVRTMEDVRVLN